MLSRKTLQHQKQIDLQCIHYVYRYFCRYMSVLRVGGLEEESVESWGVKIDIQRDVVNIDSMSIHLPWRCRPRSMCENVDRNFA